MNVDAEIMLESGLSVLQVQQRVLLEAQGISSQQPPQQVCLVIASGEALPVLGHISAP